MLGLHINVVDWVGIGKISTYCHCMPEAIEGKAFGRVDRYDCMLCRASIAEPAKSGLEKYSRSTRQ